MNHHHPPKNNPKTDNFIGSYGHFSKSNDSGDYFHWIKTFFLAAIGCDQLKDH